MRLTPVAAAAAALILTACGGPDPDDGPTDGEAVRDRAEKAQTARRRTGAELQERALNRVIRTSYLCNNGERLTVDFDNPRRMATVRNSSGQAVDLHQEQTSSGLWYRASGYELRGEGAMAVWTGDGRQPTDCRAVD